jgi:hypothetical protein
MSAERSPSVRWLAPALVALGAAAGGLGAGWFLRGSQSHDRAASSPVEAQATGALTAAELEAAKREILARLEALGRQRSASSSPAAAPADGSAIELGRRIDELDARIALLSAGARPGIGGRAWANMRGAGGESIEKITARILENDALARKNEKHEDMEAVLQREHYLWMIEDVVRAYGPPEHIETSSGLALFYGRFQIEGTDEPCFVCFRIVEGFVTDVGYDCRNGW